MASKNVETLRATLESWNRRDYDGVIRSLADNVVYHDTSRKQTINGKPKFKEWTESWARAFPDGRIINPQFTDAGDTVIVEFTAEGTNDGPFGALRPTGRRITFPFCEVWHFDKNGRLISGSCYYDQYSIFTQLGHLQPLAVAA